MKFAKKLSNSVSKGFSVPAYDFLGLAAFRAKLMFPEPVPVKVSHASERPVRLRGKFRYVRDHNGGSKYW